MSTKNALSFSEKRVSRNAVITLVIGIISLAGFMILLLSSILSGGKAGLGVGLFGVIFVILSVFGVIYGLLSYDDIRTNQRFKISGITLNVIVIFLGITLFMLS